MPADRDLLVRWQSVAEGPRDALASVDYSAGNGRTWQTVYSGPDTGRVSIPGAYLTGGRRARVRVSVNAGFGDATAVSKPFRVVGAPPVAVITAPTKATPLRAGVPAVLAGSASDSAGRPLTGRALTWFAGRSRLGRGATLVTTKLRRGRTRLRLVARDAAGVRGTATRTVRVSGSR